jgi:UDP-glucose 4-epimerase
MLLIIGGFNEIGYNFIKELNKKQEKIILIENFKDKDIKLWNDLYKENKNLKLYTIDSIHYKDLLHIFNWNEINCIINFQNHYNDKLDFYYNNFMIHFNLLKLCKLFNISNYIFSISYNNSNNYSSNNLKNIYLDLITIINTKILFIFYDLEKKINIIENHLKLYNEFKEILETKIVEL